MALGPRWRQLTLTLQEHTVEGRKKGFYKKKSPRPVDWWAYDQAQIHEACDVVDSIRIGVDQVCLDLGSYLGRRRGRGRPRKNGVYGVGDLAKALLVQ
jgi:hypothetical protein